MFKKEKELSAIEIARLTVPAGLKEAKHAVGGVAGLYLRVKETGARSWMYRTNVGSKRKEIGLGPYPAIKLVDAKRMALEWRAKIINDGVDPIEQRKIAKTRLKADQDKLTFAQCAEQFIKMKSTSWKNGKHTAQWNATLETYCYPRIGDKKVDQVDRDDILHILQKDDFWTEKPETASRVRARLENILDWATAMGHRQGDNPARYKGNIQILLAPIPKEKRVQHFRSLPYKKLPEFMAKLVKNDTPAAKLLQFLIMNASRASEARHAQWEQFDLKAGVWTVPAALMKMGKEHRVPLSKQALDLVNNQIKMQSGFVFESPSMKQYDENVTNMLAKSIDADATAHGFRSTFRDWAAEQTDYPSDMCEMALAHKVGSAVERAYRRTDMLEKRRQLMQDWADYCYSKVKK